MPEMSVSRQSLALVLTNKNHNTKQIKYSHPLYHKQTQDTKTTSLKNLHQKMTATWGFEGWTIIQVLS